MTQRMMNLVVKAIEAAGIKAELTTVQKNNETLTGVTFGDGKVRPTMYFTEEYDGMTSKAIAELMIKRYENLPKTPEIDPGEIMTREYIKEHVHMKLVPYNDYVKGKAARSFMDLFKLFYIDTPVENGFINATCILPDYSWENNGFSDTEIKDFQEILKQRANFLPEFL